jgi:hypothetical protein
MKLTKQERNAIMAKILPKVFARAALAKNHGIDIVNQPYEHWSFQLDLHEAPESTTISQGVENGR